MLYSKKLNKHFPNYDPSKNNPVFHLQKGSEERGEFFLSLLQ